MTCNRCWEFFLFVIWLRIKLRHCEKATKFGGKNLSLVFMFTCVVTSQQVGTFLNILCPFQNTRTLNRYTLGQSVAMSKVQKPLISEWPHFSCIIFCLIFRKSSLDITFYKYIPIFTNFWMMRSLNCSADQNKTILWSAHARTGKNR